MTARRNVKMAVAVRVTSERGARTQQQNEQEMQECSIFDPTIEHWQVVCKLKSPKEEGDHQPQPRVRSDGTDSDDFDCTK